ncbi:MAG: hypothetical protein JSU96_20015 [Acidobacteriota bacterium]|nr:MAG: hypothetical protein JSU96_20015 [Acidobacteriota bacterium]
MSGRSRVSSLIKLIALFLSVSSSFAEIAETDGPGNIRKLRISGTRLSIATDVWMPAKGWGATARTRDLWNVSNVTSTGSGDEQIWTGRVSVPGGPSFDYRQTLRESDGKIHWGIRVTSRTSADIEGVYFFLRFPVNVFAQGDFRFLSGQSVVDEILLPDIYPGQPHLGNNASTAIELTDELEQYRVGVDFDRSRSVTIQDNRAWGEPYFTFFYPFHSGNLGFGGSVSTEITIQTTGSVETGPVEVTIDSETTEEFFDGWGGNFVFCNTEPEVDYLLSELRVAWARSGMSMRDWEPQNDNNSADSINWSYYESRARPGSTLDREFRAARDLEDRGIPHIVSIWWLPTWLQPTESTSIPKDKWPELREMVGSYLLYAKEHYGVEPDFFSFNEPDLGIYVLFSAEDHAEAIKTFGSYFDSLGLKTKLLLGDAANASNPGYVDAGASDPEALKYAGAVAFHSWNGSTQALLNQWRVKAKTLNLPLLVTEVGSDPAAYHYPAIFWTYGYALDDLENYMQFLTHSRPRSALQWELTCDYPLVDVGSNSVRTSKRFFFVKHLANLTPPQAEYIDVTTSDTRVWALGFRGAAASSPSSSELAEDRLLGNDAADRLVIHVANLGPARTAKLRGLPASTVSLLGVRTSEGEEFAAIGSLPVIDGTVEVTLSEQSLTTLIAPMQAAGDLQFAHFAKGLDLLASQVTLINPSIDQTRTGRLEIADDAGKPVQIEINGKDTTGQFGFTLAPAGSIRLNTESSGELVTGSARVLSDGPLDGILRFGGPVGVAGVGAGSVIEDGLILPVEYSPSKGVNTGVAIAAGVAESVEIRLELRNPGGSLRATSEETISGQGHLAKFITEFDWTGGRVEGSFLGTLVVRSSGPVTAVALQTRPGEFVTLPVTALAPSNDPSGSSAEEALHPQATASKSLHFPHFAKAEGVLESELILVNPDSTGPSQALIRLKTSEGEAMTVKLNGQEVQGALEVTIPPLGVGVWSTGREGELKVGSVSVETEQTLGGIVLFSGTVGSAGVGSSSPTTNGFIIPVERDSAEGVDTGIAVMNLDSEQADLKLELLDPSGEVVARASGQVPQQGQSARFVTQYTWDPEIDLTVFTGLLRVCSEENLTATALVSFPKQFATLPVTPVNPGDCTQALQQRADMEE